MSTIKNHPSSLIELFTSQWRNRELIIQMVKRELNSRYQGSFLGILWAFIQPLILLVVYTFVFSEVFNARWGTQVSGKTDFALALFTGMTVHNLFTEVLNKSPTLITSNTSYVKKIIFPLEILPTITIGTASIQAAISAGTILAINLLVTKQIAISALTLPLVLLPLIFFVMGISFILASLGVYIRDLSQSIGLITSVSVFLSPVFYPISALPEKYRGWLYLNPLTYIIEETRNVMLWGNFPDWYTLALYTIGSIGFATLGFNWFQKTRKGFADVI